MSSCVYILAGATHRSVEGLVGIHRPYEPDDQAMTETEQKAKYKRLGGQMVAYLRTVNVPTRLYEDSLFISPDRVKILTANELQAYGLNENDPYVDEADAVKSAKKTGVSRKEYAERELRARQECGNDGVSAQSSKSEIIAHIECTKKVLEGNR
jgi:hypothetical protein